MKPPVADPHATPALLRDGGAEALTTRAIARAAGTQAPAIYRLFGDKRGLLAAVAAYVFEAYATSKAKRESLADPVGELRAAWDEHVTFALANPEIYPLIAGGGEAERSFPAAAGYAALRARVRSVASAGRLNMSEERAVALIHAAGRGVATTLLEMPVQARDLIVADVARDAIMAAVVGEPREQAHLGAARLASALRGRITEYPHLTPGERALMDELLRRIADAPASGDASD